MNSLLRFYQPADITELHYFWQFKGLICSSDTFRLLADLSSSCRLRFFVDCRWGWFSTPKDTSRFWPHSFSVSTSLLRFYHASSDLLASFLSTILPARENFLLWGLIYLDCAHSNNPRSLYTIHNLYLYSKFFGHIVGHCQLQDVWHVWRTLLCLL